MENKDYTSEILGIIRSNASPGVMRNQLEDYHENDLAEVFPDLYKNHTKVCFTIKEKGIIMVEGL